MLMNTISTSSVQVFKLETVKGKDSWSEMHATPTYKFMSKQGL